MSLTPGARLGPYDIVALLGVGGMGEVYRATDTNLKRAVAIKVLPASVATDPERLARFQREAQVLAALNHPHIAQIYGLEKAGGVTALVLELVEGPTLADRIAQGPIPLDEALPIARQIAEALETAHGQGIIHRDLKPANIKVRPDGTVKVLDFGLAKALEPAGVGSTPASLANSPTITSPAMMTGVGVILGTAAYMSPEQAKGRPADKRSDVWAFGCVLYEMLTGRRAFAGDDVSDTLVSVMRDEPTWAALPVDTPNGVHQTLRVCLRKDLKQRVSDIVAIKLALDGAFDIPKFLGPSAVASQRIEAGWQRALPWAIAAVMTGAAGYVFMLNREDVTPAQHASRFVIAPEPNAPLRPPGQSSIAISPDGTRLAYRTGLETTAGLLYIREIDQFEAQPLAGTAGAGGFAFSADGQSIVFQDMRDFRLKRISLSGGSASIICGLDDGLLRGASWGLDDTIVFATDRSGGLMRVPANGGTPERITTADLAKGDREHYWPQQFPDGRAVLFSTSDGGSGGSEHVKVVTLSNREVSVLMDGGNGRVTSTGHLLFTVHDQTRASVALYAASFDSNSLRVTGTPVRVLDQVAVEQNGGAHFAVANNGTFVYVSDFGSFVSPRAPVWVDRTGKEEPINVTPRAFAYARLSPDNTKVALDARDETNDIWIWEFARGVLRRFTTDPGLNRLPVWTPDSKRLAFTAVRDGVESVYWQAADGAGVLERLSQGTASEGPQSFSPNGQQLVFSTPLTGPFDIGVMSFGASPTRTMLLHSRFSETNAELSTDGRWLAYSSDESRVSEVYVRPFPNVDTTRKQVSTGGGSRPLWSHDGRELFYFVGPDTIMAVPVQSRGDDIDLGSPHVILKGPYAPALNGRHYDVSQDGKRFMLLKDVSLASGQRPSSREIHLVLNWFEDLKARVPTK